MVVYTLNFDDPSTFIKVPEDLEFEVLEDLGIGELTLTRVLDVGPLLNELLIDTDADNLGPDLLFNGQYVPHSAHEKHEQEHLVIFFKDDLRFGPRQGRDWELEFSSPQVIRQTFIDPE